MRRSFVVFPLVALVLGFLLAGLRGQGTSVEQGALEVVGLPPRLEYDALLVDARRPRLLYVGTDDGVYVTRNAGRDWRSSGLEGERIDALAQLAGRTVYAASAARVWRLGDAGWVRDPSRPEPLGWRTQPDPHAPSRQLATGASLRLSADGGKTWRTVLEASGGVNAAAWSPSERGVAYAVAGDGQLYRSDDGGETWLVAGEPPGFVSASGRAASRSTNGADTSSSSSAGGAALE